SSPPRADKSSLYDIDRALLVDIVLDAGRDCRTKDRLGANVMRLFPNRGHTLEPAAAPDQVTIRRAYPDDAGALVRLAALDCRGLPPGELLVADVGGELWAAVSISSDLAIA